MSSVQILKAPWTSKQISNLVKRQAVGYLHEYTCGKDDCRNPLKPFPDGWHCSDLECEYVQDWCFEFDAQDQDYSCPLCELGYNPHKS